MTARRTTRKAVSTDIIIPATEDLPEVNVTRDVKIVDGETGEIVVADTKPARKYMSHENCDHARKGEAGKAARQVCRRNHRAWFAAEAEWLASQESDAIAV